MGDGDLLLRAILADPADDTPRLVYADWCDENGEPERAEVIRLGVEVGRLGLPDGPCPPGCPCGGAGNRAAALVAERGDVWNPRLRGERPGGLSFSWRRGFPDELHCTLADFERHAADVFARHPVTAVTLFDVVVYQLDHAATGRDWTYSLPGGGSLPFDPDPAVWWHPDADSVRRHLSAACVTYGRKLAGLPPLPAAGTRAA